MPFDSPEQNPFVPFGGFAQGQVVYVTLEGNDNNDGFSWLTAKRTAAAAFTQTYFSSSLSYGLLQFGPGTFDIGTVGSSDPGFVAGGVYTAAHEGIPNLVSINGWGRTGAQQATILNYVGNGPYAMETAKSDSSVYGGRLSNFRLTCPGGAAATQKGLHLRNLQNNALFDNLQINGFPAGQGVLETTSGSNGDLGFYYLRGCWFNGGVNPLTIGGCYTSGIMIGGAADADATTTTALRQISSAGAGMITGSLTLIGVKTEAVPAGAKGHSFQDPYTIVTSIGCCIHMTSTSLAAFEYTPALAYPGNLRIINGECSNTTGAAVSAPNFTTGAVSIAGPGNGVRQSVQWPNIAATAQTPPAVPATTVALTNPFGFGCLVSVFGGTVTVIAINGVNVGTTDGMLLVPAGQTIALTYTVAPTWTWYGPI